MSTHRFPDAFLWGVATAGHQNEGNNTGSDTWFLENVTPTVFREPSGRACNSWQLWRKDLDLAKAMGLNAFRFSVEWARVEPVEGEFSDDALAHYEDVVDGCLERGLAPVVTLNHFTAPHWFAERGSWLAPSAPEAFARYSDRVVERFGDRIATVVTLNEPNLPRLLTWVLPPAVHELQRLTLDAASAQAGVERYRAANVVITEELDALEDGLVAGHLAARRVVKARHPELPVGLSLAVVDDQVVGDDGSLRDRKRELCYGRWLELAAADDFVGVQNYERALYDGNGPVPAPPEVPRNSMGSAIEPLSLAGAVAYVHAACGVPVFVTEHGMATADDTERAGFLEPALAGLAEVIEQGVPVLGYMHWTLLDNFEWIFGYGMQLGLHEVDRETFERTPKASAARYAALVRAYREASQGHTVQAP